MSESANPPLLRIFSGPHAGAELILIEDEYLAGSSSSCDLVLSDSQIDAEHVRILVEGGTVSIRANDGSRVYVEGKAVQESVLQPFQYLTIGNTSLACGPQGSEWPVRELPSPAQDLTPETESSPELADNEETADAPVSQTEDFETEPASKVRRRSNSALVWGTVLVLLASVTALLLSGAFGRDSEGDDGIVGVEQLEAIITNIAPNSTVKIVEEEGLFSATGCVATRQLKADLEEALLSAMPTIETSGIRDAERMAESVRRFLRMRRLSDLQVGFGEIPGHIVVTGRTDSEDAWLKAREDIQTKTNTVLLVDNVLVGDEMPPAEPAPVAPEPTVVETTDSAPEEETVAPPPPRREKVATPETPRPRGLPFKIRDVTLGRASFFTTDTGAKVYEDSVIRGYLVKEITEQHIVLMQGPQEFILNIGL